MGGGSALESNPVVRQKKYLRIPSIDKWYPLHIPSLDFCIPFSCCKCIVFKRWINHKKNRRILDCFIAIRCICKPFRIFLQTKMTDFPTRSGGREGGGGESYFPYILFNEIQTMLSQLAKRITQKPKINGFWEGTKLWRSKAGLFLTIIFW